MGGGSWSASTYASTTRAKVDSGTSFAYSAATRSSSASSWSAHDDLDPKKVAGAGSPLAGQIVRESRDNDEHPNSTPIAVFFDETGSMGYVPVELQSKLGELYGLILRKGYAEDPQVLIGAYGDTHSDRVPLQVSQFESDNRIDDNLDKLFLEGNGGGNRGESMSLAWYYTAAHTATDSWDKRGKKGYAFFIGDEVSHALSADDVKTYIGDGEPLVPVDDKGLVEALQEKWDAYVLVINNWSAQSQGSVKFYTELFGDRCIVLEDPNSVSETIALLIGVLEGTIDLDEGADDLKAIGVSDSVVRSATKALATVGDSGSGRQVGQVAYSETPPGL